MYEPNMLYSIIRMNNTMNALANHIGVDTGSMVAGKVFVSSTNSEPRIFCK